MRYFAFILFSTFLLISSFGSVRAQDINAETATMIKNKMAEVMSGMFPSMDDIDVKMMDDHYLISLNQDFKDEESGVELTIKGFEGKYYPTNNPSQFNVESLVKKDNLIRITALKDGIEPEVIEVKILGDASRKNLALLDLDIGQYLSMSETINQMQITMHQGDVKKADMMVDTTTVIAKYTPSQTGEGLIDGNMGMIMNGLSGDAFNPKKESEKFAMAIDSIVVDSAVRDWDVQKAKTMQADLIADQDNIRILDLFSAARINASKLTINGIKAMDMAGKTVFNLDEISYKGGASNINSDNAEMSFSVGFGGLLKTFVLSDDPSIKVLQSLMPNDMKIKIKGTDIPMLAFEKEMQAIQKNSEGGGDTKQLVKQNKDRIISLLADNNASTTFNFDLGGEDFSVELQSNLTADKTSPLSILGDVTLQFFNMDQYLKQAMALAKNNKDNPMVGQNLPKAMGGVAMLQMFGQQKTDPIRGDYREYKIVFDETGNISLNGAPISQIMGGMMSQPQ